MFTVLQLPWTNDGSEAVNGTDSNNDLKTFKFSYHFQVGDTQLFFFSFVIFIYSSNKSSVCLVNMLQ